MWQVIESGPKQWFSSQEDFNLLDDFFFPSDWLPRSLQHCRSWSGAMLVDGCLPAEIKGSQISLRFNRLGIISARHVPYCVTHGLWHYSPAHRILSVGIVAWFKRSVLRVLYLGINLVGWWQFRAGCKVWSPSYRSTHIWPLTHVIMRCVYMMNVDEKQARPVTTSVTNKLFWREYLHTLMQTNESCSGWETFAALTAVIPRELYLVLTGRTLFILISLFL